MPLTFHGEDMVFIFWLGRRFKSQYLSKSVTLQPVSRQAVELRSKLCGKYSGASVTAVVV